MSHYANLNYIILCNTVSHISAKGQQYYEYIASRHPLIDGGVVAIVLNRVIDLQ